MSAMKTLEVLADRTWKTQRVLLMPVVGLGAMVLIGGLISGVPVISGLGFALGFGGAFGIWRLAKKSAGFKALLAAPQRVKSVIPIIQTLQGVVTNYPVVVVADDGTPYRIGTWTRSVPEALIPFQQHFPHAGGLEGDSVFAPDDGFGARFKLIGVMLGSVLVGFAAAGLLVLPRTLAHLSRMDVFFERQTKRNHNEADALAAVAKISPQQSWSACSIESLEPSVSVLLDGARSKSWSPRREGSMSSRYALTLSTATEPTVYRKGFIEAWVDGMTGSRFHEAEMKRGWGIVGARRDDALHLRLLDLDDGRVICEGLAHLPAAAPDSAYAEDKMLAEAVMRPFCAQIAESACDGLFAEPTAAVGSAPVGVADEKKKAIPSAPAVPASPKGGLDRDSILATVRTSSGRTRACYEKALLKQPRLQGTLTIAFVVGRDGRVTSAQASGFSDAAVSTCVSKVFQSLRFPAPADGKSVPVKYPIVFKPAG